MTVKKAVTKKKVTKSKTVAPKKVVNRVAPKKEAFTHIDRSNGTFLRTSDLDKKRPWLSPISGQATVEKLTEVELEKL